MPSKTAIILVATLALATSAIADVDRPRLFYPPRINRDADDEITKRSVLDNVLKSLNNMMGVLPADADHAPRDQSEIPTEVAALDGTGFQNPDPQPQVTTSSTRTRTRNRTRPQTNTPSTGILLGPDNVISLSDKTQESTRTFPSNAPADVIFPSSNSLSDKNQVSTQTLSSNGPADVITPPATQPTEGQIIVPADVDGNHISAGRLVDTVGSEANQVPPQPVSVVTDSSIQTKTPLESQNVAITTELPQPLPNQALSQQTPDERLPPSSLATPESSTTNKTSTEQLTTPDDGLLPPTPITQESSLIKPTEMPSNQTTTDEGLLTPAPITQESSLINPTEMPSNQTTTDEGLLTQTSITQESSLINPTEIPLIKSAEMPSNQTTGQGLLPNSTLTTSESPKTNTNGTVLVPAPPLTNSETPQVKSNDTMPHKATDGDLVTDLPPVSPVTDTVPDKTIDEGMTTVVPLITPIAESTHVNPNGTVSYKTSDGELTPETPLVKSNGTMAHKTTDEDATSTSSDTQPTLITTNLPVLNQTKPDNGTVTSAHSGDHVDDGATTPSTIGALPTLHKNETSATFSSMTSSMETSSETASSSTTKAPSIIADTSTEATTTIDTTLDLLPIIKTANSEKMLPTNVPDAVVISNILPEGSTIVNIGFDCSLDYYSVTGNLDEAKYISMNLTMAVANIDNIDVNQYHVMQLLPLKNKDKNNCNRTIAQLSYPISLKGGDKTDPLVKLNESLWDRGSRLYTNDNPQVRKVAQHIDPAIISLFDKAAQGAMKKGGNSPSVVNDAVGSNGGTDQTNQPGSEPSKVAGITAGAVCLFAMYGAVMFIFARRYKRKRQNRRRTSSVSSNANKDAAPSGEMQFAGNGSPALLGGALLSSNSRPETYGGQEVNSVDSSGRTNNISGPVAAENSLGWN